MPRNIRYPSVYDLDEENERQKQVLLKHINNIRERPRFRYRPGMRPTSGQALWFYAKCLAALVGLAGIAVLVWIEVAAWFTLKG